MPGRGAGVTSRRPGWRSSCAPGGAVELPEIGEQGIARRIAAAEDDEDVAPSVECDARQVARARASCGGQQLPAGGAPDQWGAEPKPPIRTSAARSASKAGRAAITR